MSTKTFLVAQVIRSLREHPEDWTFTDSWARNKHLKIQCYKKGGPTLVDIWFNNNVVIREWKNPLAYFVPWRCRLIHALRNAARDFEMKKVSLKIEDSFETKTSDNAVVQAWMNNLAAQIHQAGWYGRRERR